VSNLLLQSSTDALLLQDATYLLLQVDNGVRHWWFNRTFVVMGYPLA
jgi:lipoate-protein ligase A